MNIKSAFITITSIILIFLSLQSASQTVDPAMVSYLQSLSKSQQIAFAEQYGIDLSGFPNSTDNSKQTLAQIGEPLEQPENENINTIDELLKQKNSDEHTELQRYGMQLFDQEVSTFAPTDNAQVPNDYRLGVGDELIIQLLGKENKEIFVEVNRNGQIHIPKVGNIIVAGTLFSNATRLIQDRVSNSLLGVDAVIAMGRLRVINVFMAGEIKVPGAYSVSSLTTISQALFQAGGISEIGSLRNVQVKRQGETVATFDVYDLLLRGNSSQDIRLRSSDVIFVPTYSAIIEVSGEVKRPMLYEITKDETINDALIMAGGLKSTALNSKLVLMQRTKESELPEVKNVDLSDINEINQTLFDGDKIIVQPLSDALTNSVSLKGAVIRPGSYGWSEGLRFSEIISNVSRDLEKTADLEYALIIREKNENLEIEVHQFSIINALLNKKSDTDPILQMNDQILVFDNVNIDKFDTEKNDLSLNRIRENISMNGSTKNILSTEEISNSLDYNNLEKSNNSRETLLKPIIDKLKSQAREGSPVRIASISGAVKLPGQYPISEESNAYELVNAAGGFLDSAFIQSVEVRRIEETIDGNVEANYLQYDLTTDKALKGLLLKSRDNLNVRKNSNWNPQDTIKLSGEVRFPGEYLISKGETLRSVIARAGGLTSEAFAEGAIFTREVIANMEAERAKDFALQVRKDYASSILTEETNDTTFEDILSITSQLETFEGQGRLLIDLNAVLQDGENGNITVTDGDALMIPKISKTITVVGEVRRQGSHTFLNSLEIDDYLALSAGVTKRADNDGIYIVKANGSVVIPNNSLTTFSQRNASLQIGDTIVVPVNTQYKDSVPFWRDVTQIIYQGTVAIAAIARL